MVEAVGRSFVGIPCNLGKRSQSEALSARIPNEVDWVDILVNNVGTVTRSPAEDFPLNRWDEIIETNLTAPFISTRLKSAHAGARPG